MQEDVTLVMNTFEETEKIDQNPKKKESSLKAESISSVTEYQSSKWTNQEI